MRKDYGKALRELFAQGMAQRFPAWRAVTPPASHYWPGERVFVHEGHPVAWQVLIVGPDPKGREAFRVELGWSTLRRVPLLSMRPLPDDPRGSKAQAREEFVYALGDVMPDRKSCDWVVQPAPKLGSTVNAVVSALMSPQQPITAAQARAAVGPRVDAALAALAGPWGLSYLESCLQSLESTRDGAARARDAAKEIARRIVSGDLDPYGGAMQIWKDVLDPAFDPMRDHVPDDLWKFKSLASAIQDTLAQASGSSREAALTRFRDEIHQAARRLAGDC